MLKNFPALRRHAAVLILPVLIVLGACAAPVEEAEQVIDGVPLSQMVEGYTPMQDGVYYVPAVPPAYLEGVNRRALVVYPGPDSAGTIVVDPHAKFLFWVLEDGMAIRYPIAVGREGRGLRGESVINRKAEWPGWTPTANMLRREPEVYGQFRGGVPGGPASPLGARAMYLYRGGADTFYRIHGTNDLQSIGNSGSAGCIRLFNQDIIDLYDRVPSGTRVRIRTYEESVRYEGEILANRGVELPPFYISAEDLLSGAQTESDVMPEAQADDGGPVFADLL